jgi:hypothetical protein
MQGTSPSRIPVPKVQAVGLAGAIVTILIYAASFFGVTLPGEVAAALTTIIVSVAGYLTKP